MEEKNPLYAGFEGKYNAVPFSEIKPGHYEPAIERGIRIAKEEIEAICSNPETPTFGNTIVALERCGKDLDRVLNVFYPLTSALSDDELMDISMRVAPKLSEYSTSITLNERLWQRIKQVYEERDKYDLDSEDTMLLTETYDSFRRSGALLADKDKESHKTIKAVLTDLATIFVQQV